MLRNVSWPAAAVLLAALGASLSGCEEKPLDPQEYGEVLDSVPKVPGADQPYPLPKLEAPPMAGPDEQKPAENSAGSASAAGPVAPGK